MPDNTQNFNRYSYCLNNPLIYTDPSGEIFGSLFTGAIEFWKAVGKSVFGFYKTLYTDWDFAGYKNDFNDNWANFDPTNPGTTFSQAIEIDAGLFRVDDNRTFAGQVLQLVSRFTWESRQTILGNSISHARNIGGYVDNVDYYGGATLINNDVPDEWWDRWGFTLGPYINSKNVVADPYVDELFRHEYGHTLQSRLLGPLYFQNVIIPSPISNAIDGKLGHDHNSSWFETHANRMAYRYFRNHEPHSLFYDPETGRGRRWDNSRYPRHYRPDWFWFLAPPPPWLYLFN